MINAEQIRAARALLDWSTAELAKQAGLTVNGINKIERGHVQAHRETIQKLQEVFESVGVEFLDFNGVRRRPEGIEVLEGYKGFERFYDQIYAHVQQYGGLICVSGVDEKLFVKHQGEFAVPHMERMAKLAKQRGDFEMRILIEEGDYNFVASDYAKYKWQASKHFAPTPFYVYGENLALISFLHNPPPLVMLIKSASFAEAYRLSFDLAWSGAQEPSQKKGGH